MITTNTANIKNKLITFMYDECKLETPKSSSNAMYKCSSICWFAIEYVAKTMTNYGYFHSKLHNKIIKKYLKVSF
jgi:hypothetical protein